MRTLFFVGTWVGACTWLSVAGCIRDPGAATEAPDAIPEAFDARGPSIDGAPVIDAAQAADRGATPRDVARPDTAPPDAAPPDAATADGALPDAALPDAAEVPADARTIDPQAPLINDAGSLDAAAPDMLAPDIGRWPIEAYCPPLDCAQLPTWEGPEGLACAPPAEGLTCPIAPLVCPDDLTQLRPGPDGCIRFYNCWGGPHGPECDGQAECDSCLLDEETGERWVEAADTECCFQGPYVSRLSTWPWSEWSSVEYDARGRPTSWRSEWVGAHWRDWSATGECRYDLEGRLVDYHVYEDE